LESSFVSINLAETASASFSDERNTNAITGQPAEADFSKQNIRNSFRQNQLQKSLWWIFSTARKGLLLARKQAVELKLRITAEN